MILIACNATALQLDRQARKEPALAQYVPKAWRAYALRELAIDAYAHNQTTEGIAYARDFIRRRPAPSTGFSLLTRGMVMSGRSQDALPVLLLAAGRGWRDPFTQFLIANSALHSGEFQTSAQRLIALWRLGERDDTVKGVTIELLSKPEGLKAFVDALVPNDTWAPALLSDAAASGIVANQVDTFAQAIVHTGIAVSCEQVSPSVQRLAGIGKAREAAVIWSRLCAKEPATAPDDLRFHATDGLPGPFDWVYPEQAGLTIQLTAQGEKSPTLNFTNTDHVLRALGSRIVVLPPGPHTLQVDTRESANLASSSLVLQISCLSSSGAIQRPSRIWLNDNSASFIVPQDQCAGQQLTLLASNGKGSLNTVTIH